MDYRRNFDKEFLFWFDFVIVMSNSIDVQSPNPRTTKCWRKYKNNVDHDSAESYYNRKIAVPFYQRS